jgi:hypothetical protein
MVRFVVVDTTDAEARTARIRTLLDELRLNAEDLTELAKQAVRRALQAVEQARANAVPAGKKR